MTQARSGTPVPLGATWDGRGTNFALFTEHATGVDLCLFDQPDATAESARVQLRERSEDVWHAYLPDVRPGQAYGYRVHGPQAPLQGHRFNPSKLLLDPYAKAISGPLRWSDVLAGYPAADTDPDRDLTVDNQDSAAALPKSLVVDPAFDWGQDQPLRMAWNRTVIYECHVKGMTMLHPDVPEPLRGTYLGLATEPIIEHLKSLGVTAVELLPVHHRITERHLAQLGLTNYWGYSSIGFLAPDVRFATAEGKGGHQVAEFKTMVKQMHAAGLEVILDVVYNHTGEGNQLGATVAFRGIDNAAYYRLNPSNRRLYTDFTGCGNTLDLRHPRTLQLVLDSLRYWITEMHVDGFRFDLAPALARGDEAPDSHHAFLNLVRQDPVISRAKLIAEPWDLGPDGYQLGRFPTGWAEWNSKYRDTVRRFWRGDPGQVGDLAFRLSGSSDLFEASRRGPLSSVNFVTCHDGFTLQDLVSYEAKHNQANGEANRDGSDHNLSRNWGAEGPTESVHILRRRERIKRNLMATVAFSQGVPMLSHGDELGRTQAGNNNAYCHDSPLTWIDWRISPAQREFLQFTRNVLALRSANPVLRRATYFRQHAREHGGVKDLTWLGPDGREMTTDRWHDATNHVLGMLIRAEAADEVDDFRRRVKGDAVLLLLNGGARAETFLLPALEVHGSWSELHCTAHPLPGKMPQDRINLAAHSLILLRHRPTP